MSQQQEVFDALVHLQKEIRAHHKMNVRKDYSLMLADVQASKAIHRFLENFLRQTQADQGGEASFEDWVRYTAEDAAEYGHDNAKEYLALGGDLSEKEKSESGEWIDASALAMA